MQPAVLNEFNTIKLAASFSIARFGDAEFRLAAGAPALRGKKQCHNYGLMQELRRLLGQPSSSLVCIPRMIPSSPTYERFWQRYDTPDWSNGFLTDKPYGSSFITRPDSAPEIDVPQYWELVQSLWNDKDVTLVIGERGDGKDHSLSPGMLVRAATTRVIRGPSENAYSKIDEIEEAIGVPSGTVILCLGPTATCLAERLARKGVHAIDLGHIGKFMSRRSSNVSKDVAVPSPSLPYPNVWDEYKTLNAVLAGRSIARFGDGELRIAANNGNAISQSSEKGLVHELQQILRGPTKCLPCIPMQGRGPKADRWANYARPKFVTLMRQKEYGSAFITRPDSAGVEFTESYWHSVRRIWQNRDTTLVVGTDYGSLNEDMLRDAKSLRVIYGMPKNAYSEITHLEDQIGTPPFSDPVIMCLGAAATCLAERLAKKGVWAIDLGHIGKFMPKQYR